MQKEFWQNLFGQNNKKGGGILFILLMGVLLLVFSRSFYPEETEVAVEDTAVQEEADVSGRGEEEMERRMAEILSKIEGAGEVDVMLAFSTSKESVLAEAMKTEESLAEEGGKVSETRKNERSVVLTEDAKGNTTPIIISQNGAQVEGVVIVAQGGDNAVVENALNNAAQALLNLPAHKIAVMKMK